MHHVAVRHRNVTSVRDVVLVILSVLFVVRIHCDSTVMFSSCCFVHEEFSLFVSILDQLLAQGRSQLEPFGLAGVMTLQGIAEALLISNFLWLCS